MQRAFPAVRDVLFALSDTCRRGVIDEDTKARLKTALLENVQGHGGGAYRSQLSSNAYVERNARDLRAALAAFCREHCGGHAAPAAAQAPPPVLPAPAEPPTMELPSVAALAEFDDDDLFALRAAAKEALSRSRNTAVAAFAAGHRTDPLQAVPCRTLPRPK